MQNIKLLKNGTHKICRSISVLWGDCQRSNNGLIELHLYWDNDAKQWNTYNFISLLPSSFVRYTTTGKIKTMQEDDDNFTSLSKHV